MVEIEGFFLVHDSHDDDFIEGFGVNADDDIDNYDDDDDNGEDNADNARQSS